MIITVMINLPLPSKKGRSAGCQSQPHQETLDECASPLALYKTSLQILVGLIVQLVSIQYLMNALTCTRDVETVAMVQVSHTMPTRGVS